MKSFLNIIKLDYLQRTRNYNFLITLCASLAIAYTFVPEPNANYSTIRISNYVGYYNSAWFGYVTAIMSSIFLSLIGFYLVNSSIKNDITTRVGQMIASTQTSNFSYLFSKTISNFLLLLTIVLVIFIMSILLFFLYNDGYTFEFFQFVKPYLVITIPALFVIASLAVFLEVILSKYSVLQNLVFFILFSILMVFTPKNKNEFAFDVFGSKTVMYELEEKVRAITKTDKKTKLNVGYVIGNIKKPNKFTFNGVQFSNLFIISRFIWLAVALGLVFISSKIFHRFYLKDNLKSAKKTNLIDSKNGTQEIDLSTLIVTKTNFSIFPLIKIELLLAFRKGKKWLWFVNISGMVLLAFLPLNIAHKIILPILWFLQVHRISDIATKEKTHNVHLFTAVSFKPIQRIFISKIIAAFLLFFMLSLPLIIRYILNVDFLNVGFIFVGYIFLICCATLFGQLFKGKKFFEVIFFLVTYANINGISLFDYFGGTTENSLRIYYILFSAIIILILSIYKKHRVINS